MFSRLFPLLVVLTCTLTAYAEEFASDFPPTLTYSEVRDDSVYHDPDDFEDYVILSLTNLKVAAVCSMQGVNLSTIDESTTVSIDFEGLVETWTLGDDPEYQKGETTATIRLTTLGLFDPFFDDEEEIVARLKVVWDQKSVSITFTALDDSDTYQVMAQDRAYEGVAVNDYKASPKVSLSFGDRELSARTVYIGGSILFEDYQKDGISERLAHVKLSGEIDSEPPQLTLLKPRDGAEINDAIYTLAGTASDDHVMKAVLVKLNSEPEQTASLAPSGDWSLPVSFARGQNTISVRALDQDGNVTALTPRRITFAGFSNLTVNAEGTGSGEVSSALFTGFTYTPGAPSPERQTSQKDGAELTVTATPEAGALFDGWSSNYPLENASSARLTFRMQPDMTLTARFVPNVFLPVRGKYFGLLESSNPEGRGVIALQLASDGAFTGSIRLGASKVRLKGRFTAEGKYVGMVKAGERTFDIVLSLTASEGGSRQVTGTFQPHVAPAPSGMPAAPPFSSAITSDLAVYKKKVRQVPAELAGGYNVLLAPSSTNSDVNFPVGIGFGRVTLSKFGTAKLVGKLGDGTPVTASAPVSEDGFWPLYAPLYGRKGAVSGRVQFDLLHSRSDLSGTLDWFRPAGLKGVHPEGFAGQVQLTGAKYIRPATGQGPFLNPDGAGLLSIDAPRGGAALPALALDSDITLNTANQLTAADAALGLKITFKAATGLFTGSFLDATQNSKRVSFSGAVVIGGTAEAPKGNLAGGFFVRGNRTGAIQLTAPLPKIAEDP